MAEPPSNFSVNSAPEALAAASRDRAMSICKAFALMEHNAHAVSSINALDAFPNGSHDPDTDAKPAALESAVAGFAVSYSAAVASAVADSASGNVATGTQRVLQQQVTAKQRLASLLTAPPTQCEPPCAICCPLSRRDGKIRWSLRVVRQRPAAGDDGVRLFPTTNRSDHCETRGPRRNNIRGTLVGARKQVASNCGGWSTIEVIDIGWERQLHQAGSEAGLAVAAGALVVHERRTRLVGVDPVDGSARWDVHVGTWPRGIAIAGQRCLVLPQNTNQLLCLDLDTGERIWSTDLHPFTGHLVVADDTVLVGGWRGYTPLRALDTATGQLRWETDARVRTVRPAVAEGGFLIGEPDGSMVTLIDRQELREISSWFLPQPLVEHDNRAAFTAIGGHHFLVRCGSRSVVEIMPSTGIVREFVLAESDLAVSAPTHVSGQLWTHDRRAGFTVADPGDGRVLHRVDVRQPLVDQVVPVGTGFIVGGTAGTLFHLDVDGQVIARATVSRRIRALRCLDPVSVLTLTKGTLLAAPVGIVQAANSTPSPVRNRWTRL